MKRRMVALIPPLVLIGTILNAHDLFFKLDTYFLAPETEVQLAVLHGTFKVSENAIERGRVLDITLVAPQGRYHLDTVAWTARNDTSFLAIRTGAAGTYVVGVSTQADDIELEASEFNRHLEEGGIADVLSVRRHSNQLNSDAWERYSKHVKAVFQVGDVTTEHFREPLGYPAEIIPVVNPYALKRGDELRVRCLVDGIPVVHQLVIAGGVRPDGTTFTERSARTDSRGVVGFGLDGAGKWYVKFVRMVPSDREQLDYESKWATLTFEVREH